MLHIILMIIKIIGMVLLILLGILLLIILSVLLIPIRYSLSVEHGDDNFFLEGKVSWLLHVIHASFVWKDDEEQHLRIRIFGLIIYDNLRQKKTKIKKGRKLSFIKRKKANNLKGTKSEQTIKKSVSKVEHNEPDHISEDKVEKEATVITKHSNDEVTIEKKITIKTESNNGQENVDYKNSAKEDEEEKLPFIQRILYRLRSIKEKVKAFFTGIKNKAIKIYETIVNINHKKDLIMDFLRDDINKEGFKLTYYSLKKLLKHVLPTKLQSRIAFGTGDPCSTGQALGVMGFLYSLYGDKVQIIPDFENQRLEGTHYARGRIRLVTILIIVIKLMIDKRFKELRRNVKILKEAL